MAFDVDDILEVKVYSYAIDQVGLNVLHYLVSAQSAGGVPQQDVADLFSTRAALYWRPLLPLTAEYLGVAVRRVEPLPPTVAYTSNFSAAQGAAMGVLLPRQVSGLLSLRSSFAGRANRGRMFMPFPSETDSDEPGKPSAGYVLDLQILGANMRTMTLTSGANNISLQQVIFHRGTADSVDVATVVARSSWATQRRRGDFGRRNVRPIL